MKLIEKFKSWLDSNPREQLRDVQCEFIAEEFACEFTEWFWYHGTKYWRGERRNYLSMEEILKIYKEEKGL